MEECWIVFVKFSYVIDSMVVVGADCCCYFFVMEIETYLWHDRICPSSMGELF